MKQKYARISKNLKRINPPIADLPKTYHMQTLPYINPLREPTYTDYYAMEYGDHETVGPCPIKYCRYSGNDTIKRHLENVLILKSYML